MNHKIVLQFLSTSVHRIAKIIKKQGIIRTLKKFGFMKYPGVLEIFIGGNF